MARPTIASLTAALAASEALCLTQARELEAMRLQVSIATRNAPVLSAGRAAYLAAQAARNAQPAQPSAFQLACAAAKAAAMAGHKSVRVAE